MNTLHIRPWVPVALIAALTLLLPPLPAAHAAPVPSTYEGTSTQTHASDILQDEQVTRPLTFDIDSGGNLSGLSGEYWWACIVGGYHGSGFSDFSDEPIPATRITVGEPFEIQWESLSTAYTFAGTVRADGTASGTLRAHIGVCGSSLLTWQAAASGEDGGDPGNGGDRPGDDQRPDDGSFERTAPYTLEGDHTVNGRQWRTSCEPYSQTERCRTEIWATTVAIENGRFVRKDGWAFNNLTYLPFMSEAAWQGNPLASHNMDGFSSGGRQWRTECHTERTGRGACRSYTLTTVYAATARPAGGYTFSQSTQWVFNNIVLFR